MTNSTVLALYLDGPMQAWGYQSRFNRRTTLSYPTKSGVLGMLCAALGVPRSDVQTLAELVALRVEVLSFSQSRRWIDYHTVGGGYEPGSSHIPRIASGARAKNAAVTFREYLADARFGVLLSGDAQWLRRCDGALRNPVWGIWLGRKACIPASPVAQGLFPSRDAALAHLRELAGSAPFRCIAEADQFEDGTDTLPDLPLDFAAREFTVRRVRDDLPEEEP